MLFLQGTRDEFAEASLLRTLIGQLGARASLKTFEEADHSFHVPKRSGRTDEEVRTQMLDTAAEWIATGTVMT